jgi:hypothetical protein
MGAYILQKLLGSIICEMLTAISYDPKAAILEKLANSVKMYLADLGHIPADKLNAVPMGKARPPLEFTAECVGFNSFVASIASGETHPIPTEEERESFYRTVDSLEKAQTLLQESVDQLTSAVQKLDNESLFTPAKTPWGSDATIFQLVEMTCSHMAYHDGQLNYIQSLYGDDANHWH